MKEMVTTKILRLLAFVFLFFVLVFGITWLTQPSSVSQNSVEKTVEYIEPTSFGSNVYLFNVEDIYFGKVLAKFKEEHPNLRVTAITIAKQHFNSVIHGYWVNFEEK
ncbi:MAG: hypothetical protein HYT63_02790 [Candidatus Yanofskybacteria bacterium]|nr:hypothetical protein [Candidatus Yanofskybacteria bacterium]